MKVGKNTEMRIEDGVAMLALSRPPLNIINLEIMVEMLEHLDKIAQDKSVSVLVLKSGVDGVFSAGADVREHLPESAQELIHTFERLITRLLTFRTPTVAIVHGRCLGGGMELALACDFVLAEVESTFGQPEVRVGVYPPAAAALYPRIVGLKNSYKLLLTGQTITASEAYSMGIVTEVVKAEDIESRLNQTVDTLKASSGVVLEFAKRAVIENLSFPLDQALKNSSRLYLEGLMKTEDASEGLRAFLEKRKPTWRNR